MKMNNSSRLSLVFRIFLWWTTNSNALFACVVKLGPGLSQELRQTRGAQ